MPPRLPPRSGCRGGRRRGAPGLVRGARLGPGRSRARRSCRRSGAWRPRPWRAPARARRPPQGAPPRSGPPGRRRSPRRRGGSRRLRLLVGEMLDVEQPLEDPVVEARLAQLVAVEDRPHALPAFLEEAAQGPHRLGSVEVAEPVQDPGGAVDAEAALAGPHAEAQGAPDVVEVRRAAPPHGLLERPAADQLALADELLVLKRLLAPARAR